LCVCRLARRRADWHARCPAASGDARTAEHKKLSAAGLGRRAQRTPYHDRNVTKDKTVILYCASGGRSALGGKVLKDMGYAQIFNLGAFKDWVDSGGPVD
jgi:rhodanese-related sulfurtransferase